MDQRIRDILVEMCKRHVLEYVESIIRDTVEKIVNVTLDEIKGGDANGSVDDGELENIIPLGADTESEHVSQTCDDSERESVSDDISEKIQPTCEDSDQESVSDDRYVVMPPTCEDSDESPYDSTESYYSRKMKKIKTSTPIKFKKTLDSLDIERINGSDDPSNVDDIAIKIKDLNDKLVVELTGIVGKLSSRFDECIEILNMITKKMDNYESSR